MYSLLNRFSLIDAATKSTELAINLNTSKPMRQQRIAVLGLGAMGTALALTLLKTGEQLMVWNRTAAKADELRNAGATALPSLAETLDAADVVLLCLVNNEAVHSILKPHRALLQHKMVINLTNGTPGQARQLAGWVQQQNSQYLDGGIMAIPPMIGTEHAFVLYSGDEAAFKASEPFLMHFGKARFMGADAGNAALYDISLLSTMYGMMGGFIHAAALLRRSAIQATAFLPLAKAWIAAMTPSLDLLATQIDSADYQSGVTSNLAMQAAGYENLVATARELNIDPILLLPMERLLQKSLEKGYHAADLSAVIESL
nr:NAD(P)-binding domain-containing protein [Pedobacter yulinensis]